jgi:Peptidase family M28
MIDFRLYRVAWLPALAAFVVLMFSLEGVPEPIEPQVAPTAFDADRAEINTRQILNAASERQPGGEGDATVAEEVMSRFEEITAGNTASQNFTESIDGEDADLTNVILTLPGETDRTILVMAARDSASGPGAASSVAATAALVELAEVLGATEHAKTIVLVSTDAGSEGAAGAREFIGAYPDRDLIEAAIVLAQPGAAEPSKPHVLRDSTDDTSTNAQLVSIAEQAVSDQADRPPGDRGTFADLARLAMPSAAGDQSVLIAEGLDTVAFSSAGEAPLPPDTDGPDDLDPEVLAEFGSAALGTVLVLDQATTPLDHGPDTYVGFSGSLIPGWAIAVLALGVAAVTGALVSWLLNPYLALLLAPVAHVWLFAARRRPPSRGLTLALAALALVPALLALKVSAGAVGAGVWDIVLMIAGGHIGTPALIALCPICGALVGLAILAWSGALEEADVEGAGPPRTESRPTGTSRRLADVGSGHATWAD